MPVIHIKSEDEFNKHINVDKVTIVDFTAQWCGPCQMIKPFFEKYSDEYTNIQFLKVDVDELSELTDKIGINAMPTFYLYKKGEKVDEFDGGADPDGLKKMLEKYKS